MKKITTLRIHVEYDDTERENAIWSTGNYADTPALEFMNRHPITFINKMDRMITELTEQLRNNGLWENCEDQKRQLDSELDIENKVGEDARK